MNKRFPGFRFEVLLLRTISVFILFLLTLAGNASAQEGQARYTLGLTTGSFLPETATTASFTPDPATMFDQKYFRIVQFFELPTEAERVAWRASGFVLSDYLPNYCYFATISNSFGLSALQQKIRAVWEPDARIKMESDLRSRTATIGNMDGEIRLIVSYYDAIAPQSVINDLASKGFTVTTQRAYSRQLDVVTKSSRLNELIALPYVQFVGEQPGERIAEDNLAYRNAAGRANYLNTGQSSIMYNGTGVTIDVGEGGTVNNVVDFKGRLTELVTGTYSDHKIGTMQNAGGAGNLDPTNRNNAWGATLISSDNENYPNLINTYNARYFNHSYGYGIGGGYNSAARDHDLRTVAYPKHLVFYSSGNDGTSAGYAPYNNFNGWATVTGAVKQNKNHMAVRNLGPNDEIYTWGSCGPAYDGRIVPQCIIAGPEGTSYAAPKAMGVFAILEEAYKTTHAGQESNACLMKGIVLNTADDMDDPGPDFKTGYGRPNVKSAYETMLNNQFLGGSISNGASVNHTIAVPANVKQVRVMLIWPDVAAAVNANPAIVNNLDLIGKSPSNVSYNVWKLNHAPDSALLDQPAVRGLDSINTVEQVTVDNPAAGNWTFTVNGTFVPSGPQSYYLVYRFVYDELSMGYPLENERMISGENYAIKWNNSGGSGTFALKYRLNGGAWLPIAGGIDSNARSFAWQAPVVSGIQKIEFQLMRGTTVATSGINYIGKVPDNFRVFSVCNDTVTLKWSAVPGATSYKIYKLGTKYMDPVTANITFAGTMAVLTGQSTTTTEYYAVSALQGTFEGQRTKAELKAPGNLGCGGIDWIGVVSTNWFIGGNWAGGVVPSAIDNARIPSGTPYQPTIAAAGATCRNLKLEAGSVLTMSGTTAYNFTVYGDWINNGTFNAGIGSVEFHDTTNYQEITGSSTTSFYKLIVTKNTQQELLEVSSLIGLMAPANPLVLNSGTFKLSSASVITPFTDGNGANLSGSSGIWNNGGTINYGNFGWYLNSGLLRASAGTINAGTSANNAITYLNNGTITVDGGVVRISGRIRPNSSISSCTVNVFDGELILNTVGSTSTTEPALQINSSGTFNMSGGTLTIQNATSNTNADILNLAGSSLVNGGTVQVGNANTSVAQTIRIQSSVSLPNLLINAFNAPTLKLLGQDHKVSYHVTIAGGTLQSNNFNLKVGGDWINNGSFAAGTSEVLLNGFQQQSIGGSNGTTFNKLRVDNASGIVLNRDAAVSTSLQFDKGMITTGNQYFMFGDNAVALNATAEKFIDGNCRKTGDDAFQFPIGKGNMYAPIKISAPATVTDQFTTSYFHQDPNPMYNTSSLLSPLTHVSHAEYWTMTRSAGSSNVMITLSFDASRSAVIDSLQPLLVAGWNGVKWQSEGASNITGTTQSGTITSSVISQYTAFTLGDKEPVNLAVNETALSNGSIQIYPNPARDIVTIRSADPNTKLEYELIDLQGTMIRKGATTGMYTDIDLRNMNAGIYFIRLKNVSGVYRLVKY